jgi:protein arginine kinase activator
MAKEVKCNQCGKPATVHITHIINGKFQKVNLCEECAQGEGMSEVGEGALTDLLQQVVGGLGEENLADGDVGTKCPDCGYSLAQLRSSGRVGCPDCYAHFQALIKPSLRSMHKRTEHTGKIPIRSLKRHGVLKRIRELTEEMQLAVREERYEDAARLRDELNEFKKMSQESA